MTGGINYVSWNPSTVDRRKLRNNESAPYRRSPALSSLRRSKATRCDSAYSVESSFGGYERVQMRRGCASRRFAVLTHLARVQRGYCRSEPFIFEGWTDLRGGDWRAGQGAKAVRFTALLDLTKYLTT